MTSARKALLIAVTGAVLLGLSTSAAAVNEDSYKSSDVNVTVTSEVAVDLHPQSLEYEATDVGALNTTTDRGFSSVDLENVGSEYIDKIWVNATLPDTDPVGTGNANNYDAGNFLVLKPNNDSGKLLGNTDAYNFVNRVEFGTWTQAEVPSYIKAPDTGTYENPSGSGVTAANVSVGRFRVGDEEYFFAIPVSSNADRLCDGSASAINSLLVAKQPHTASDTVPIDFTDGNGYPAIDGQDYEVYNISQLGEIDGGLVQQGITLYADWDGSNVSRNYGVNTYCDDGTGIVTDQAQVIRSRYNVEMGGAGDLADDTGPQNYLLSTSSDADMLQPGEFASFDVGIEVPRGVPRGSVTSGKLTVLVTADTTATTDP